MVSLVFAVFCLVHLCLTLWLVRLALARRSAHIWPAAAVAVGLVYDNGVVALGAVLGTGGPLLALSLPRFAVHALVTPVLIVFALGAARDLGLAWARRRLARVGFWLLTAVLIVYGVVADLVGLTLMPEREGDALRYTAAESVAPIPSMVTIVVLLAVGTALLVRARTGWMLLGAVLMLAASAVPDAPLAVSNVGEVVLIAGLALTARGMGPPPAPTSP